MTQTLHRHIIFKTSRNTITAQLEMSGQSKQCQFIILITLIPNWALEIFTETGTKQEGGQQCLIIIWAIFAIVNMTHSFTWKITREEAKLKLLIYVIILSRNGNGCFGEPSREVKLRVVISPWNTSARIWIPDLIRRGLTSQTWVMF